jgi:5'-nucleotidase
MRILLANDDGYRARGLVSLREAVAAVCEEVITVAPDRNRSGASNSLTLDRPLRAREIEPNLYCVEGTPTDCVHLAITGLLDVEPDMVLSGINEGANLGDDILYSGTVAAATEGRFLGLPAVAISLVGERPENYETAGRVALAILGRLRHDPLPADTILNVNVPDLPWHALEGFEATRLGHRHRAERVVADRDPRGHPIYWIGPAGPESDAGPGTDFHAIANRKVSITPIQTDLTRFQALDQVAGWVEHL